MRVSMTLRAAVVLTVFAIAPAAQATDTVGCAAKTVWRQSVVETIVADWFEQNQSSTEDLLDLISAEQGIAACRLGKSPALHLHTSTLPRDLQRRELGGLLLANELAWSQLLPEPEEGLSGHAYTVVLPPLRSASPR